MWPVITVIILLLGVLVYLGRRYSHNKRSFKRNIDKSTMKYKKGVRVMWVIFALIIFLLVGILTYWGVDYSPNKRNFKNNINKRIENTEDAKGVYTKEEIENLPEAMQRYFKYIGCIGKEKHNVVNIFFEDTYFYMNGKDITIDYDLWLITDKPYRGACITSSLYGIPFEGMDYMDDEAKEGGMKGVLGKAITIFDTHNKQMYDAGLISWIIEGLINPTILLSPYITYNQIDYNHVEVSVEYDGAKGSGIYTIDDGGRIVKFESWERQVEKINGVDTYLGWFCDMSEYEENNGIKIPTKMSASTVYPDKIQKYFESRDIEVNYYK